MRVLGLMSGTSADGIDAVLVEFKGDSLKPKWEILNFLTKNVIEESLVWEKVWSSNFGTN